MDRIWLMASVDAEMSVRVNSFRMGCLVGLVLVLSARLVLGAPRCWLLVGFRDRSLLLAVMLLAHAQVVKTYVAYLNVVHLCCKSDLHTRNVSLLQQASNLASRIDLRSERR